MRVYVPQLLGADAALNALGITDDSIYAGDVDTVDERPFVTLRWLATVPGVSTVNERGLQVWVNDWPSDYTRIDQIQQRIRAVLTPVHAVQTSTGWITEIRWINESDDLSDEGNNSIFRQATYAIIGSGI